MSVRYALQHKEGEMDDAIESLVGAADRCFADAEALDGTDEGERAYAYGLAALNEADRLRDARRVVAEMEARAERLPDEALESLIFALLAMQQDRHAPAYGAA